MSDRTKAIIALIVVLAAWSLAGVFVKYLINAGYDAHTQNFYRYVAGTVAVLPFLVAGIRQRGVKLNGPLLARMSAIALPNLIHQISWVVALNWINPGLSSFLNKSSVLFAALLAFALFPEERWLFRSGRFLTGLGLTVGGTIGLAMLRGDLDRVDVNFGIGLVMLAAISWATYSVAVKRPSVEIGPTIAFGIVGIFTTIALFFVALHWGHLAMWNQAPWHVNAIMVFSGVLCIGLAHTLYYYAMRVLTVSVCATMLLTTPLGTLLISRWLFGEHMTASQIVSGIILIIGGFLTMMAKQRPVPTELARAAEAADA